VHVDQAKSWMTAFASQLEKRIEIFVDLEDDGSLLIISTPRNAKNPSLAKMQLAYAMPSLGSTVLLV